MLLRERAFENSFPTSSRPFSIAVETPCNIPSIAAVSNVAGIVSIGVATDMNAAIGSLPAAELTEGDFAALARLTCDGFNRCTFK